jgi:glycosyltransferase involved in cell wall biosynthesis
MKEFVNARISVIMPVYNGERYLRDAIESILNQTFSNFEFIIIDDGSTDATPDIIREYENREPRIRAMIRRNHGLATTLNFSIEMARGEWIARMDHDDIALPHRLARQLEWLESTGADITGSWVQRFESPDRRVIGFSQSDEAIKMEMLFRSPFAHPSVMMKTDLARQLRYDENLDCAQDFDLWTRAAEAGWKMTNVPEILLLYRVHARQITTKSGIEQRRLAQGIRRRYWEFVFKSLQLDQNWIDASLRMVEPPLFEFDMDIVDSSFAGLLEHSRGESREVVFSHMTLLYTMAASYSPGIASRWGRLNQEYGIGWGVSTKLKIWLFRIFRIRREGVLFVQLRRLYLWGTSRW